MELSWCKDAEWCEVRRCGIEKNLNDAMSVHLRNAVRDYMQKKSSIEFSLNLPDVMGLKNFLIVWNEMNRQVSFIIGKE